MFLMFSGRINTSDIPYDWGYQHPHCQKTQVFFVEDQLFKNDRKELLITQRLCLDKIQIFMPDQTWFY